MGPGDRRRQAGARCVGLGRRHAVPGGAAVIALADFDAEVPAGAITVAAGPSGSGKSTLLRLVACLDAPTEGRLEVGGVTVTGLSARRLRALRRRTVSYVFQDPADNLISYLTVREQVELAAALRGAEPAQGMALLEEVGLGGRLDELPVALSGGEQQRVALVCGAVGAPALLVADEPTAELDRASAVLVLDAVQRLRDLGSTVLLSSHDDLVLERADHLLRLQDGRLV